MSGGEKGRSSTINPISLLQINSANFFGTQMRKTIRPVCNSNVRLSSRSNNKVSPFLSIKCNMQTRNNMKNNVPLGQSAQCLMKLENIFRHVAVQSRKKREKKPFKPYASLMHFGCTFCSSYVSSLFLSTSSENVLNY